MKTLLRKFDDFIRSMLGNLDATGRAWARLGIVVLIAAAAMSWDFGASMSIKHAIFLTCLTAVAAFGPEEAYKSIQQRKFGSGIAIAAICVPLLGIEFLSHAGYTAGMRGMDMTEAKVANVRYDGAQESVQESKANYALWSSQLAKLQEQAPWAAAVKAEALRGQMAVAEKEIADETARGGCKAKCTLRMKDKANLAERIGQIEQMASLTERIEATKRVLDTARDKASTTEHKTSAADLQARFFSKAVALIGYRSLKPSETIEVSAEQTTNLLMAFAGTGLPAFCLFIAGLHRKPDEDGDTSARAAFARQPMSPEPQKLRMLTTTKTIDNTDYTHRDTLAALVRRLETAKAA